MARTAIILSVVLLITPQSCRSVLTYPTSENENLFTAADLAKTEGPPAPARYKCRGSVAPERLYRVYCNVHFGPAARSRRSLAGVLALAFGFGKMPVYSMSPLRPCEVSESHGIAAHTDHMTMSAPAGLGSTKARHAPVILGTPGACDHCFAGLCVMASGCSAGSWLSSTITIAIPFAASTRQSAERRLVLVTHSSPPPTPPPTSLL